MKPSGSNAWCLWMEASVELHRDAESFSCEAAAYFGFLVCGTEWMDCMLMGKRIWSTGWNTVWIKFTDRFSNELYIFVLSLLAPSGYGGTRDFYFPPPSESPSLYLPASLTFHFFSNLIRKCIFSPLPIALNFPLSLLLFNTVNSCILLCVVNNEA